MGKLSQEDRIVMKALGVTTYELKKLELSERICGPKVVQTVIQSTHQKSVCWFTNRQTFYWSRSYVRLSL